MNALITVIVTVYNIAEYLPRFFDTIAKQTYKDYVLLMVDDGSEDNSLEICNQFAAKDERIRVLSLEHVGIAKARNIAMEHIHTEFTAYADGDDYVEPDYLKHLIEAREKYNADLVISNVSYRNEIDFSIMAKFPKRGELCIDKDEFATYLPQLLKDRRLNYLYAKVYRSSLLKDIRVEDDVRQGSDTMINCMYVKKINRIVLIDDADYNYIKYSQRSVTSYSGKDAFNRLCRINRFITDQMMDSPYYSDEMLKVIDERILISAVWVIEKIMQSRISNKEKAAQITELLNNDLYLSSYERQKNNKTFYFTLIPPQKGSSYLCRWYKTRTIAFIKKTLNKGNTIKRL